ncbi:acyl transferase/acyl hydrolase/lysophospholipase [Xylariaceae sp. FL1272]|nr:acyl transferase/acyl hydrolase/lysophospholipase [Xylariaceae sp. FL1272]
MTFLMDILPSVVPSILPTRPKRTSTIRRKNQTKPSLPLLSLAAPLSRAYHSLLYLKDGMNQHEREGKKFRDQRSHLLRARMLHAESFAQWDAAAHELDVLEGNEEWKVAISIGDYNPDLLEVRLRELDEARLNGDMRAMMHIIRTALSRDLGGMGNIDLYRHSYCGTKKLIEQYVDSTLRTITTLVDRSAQLDPCGRPGDLAPRDLLDSMLYARQSFGRSALLLSGGATFGMSHIGVLKALFEAKLLPRIISGASAGSIVCAVFCSKTDDEVPQLIQDFPNGDLAVFEEEGNEDGLIDHLRRMLTEGNWSDIKHLTRVMRDLLGDITFQEAYNRTRRICNICVSTASIYELPRLLNYVTAPNVMIWSAVATSCSVPLVFSAGALLVKNPLTGEHSPWNPTPQAWIDGSVDNDLPMTRLAEMFNVNHFIVSQVNPHVVPFLAKEDTAAPLIRDHHTVHKEERDWLHTMTSLAKSEALHRMQLMAEIGVFPNLVGKLRSILSQKYSGDINILPAIGVLDLPNILRNPTTDFMTRSCLLGERATWPKLSRIRDRCAIELALDRAVHALRARVVFSKSQVDLRRMATGPLATAHSRGSHEPLASGPTSVHRVSSRDKLKHRQRRLSAGNLLNPHLYHVAHDTPYKVTDDDTDDEERLEMALRHHRGNPKLKLKKLPKSNGLPSGARTGPIMSSTSGGDEFDFSRPLTPPDRGTGGGHEKTLSPLGVLSSRLKMEVSEPITDTTSSMTSPPSLPRKNVGFETSDAHTSDADIESHTDADISECAFRSPVPGGEESWVIRDQTKGAVGVPLVEDMFSLARRDRGGNSIDEGVDPWG